MTNSIADSSQRKAARVAGVLYLIVIVAGVSAEFFVRQRLIVPGNATATPIISWLLRGYSVSAF